MHLKTHSGKKRHIFLWHKANLGAHLEHCFSFASTSLWASNSRPETSHAQQSICSVRQSIFIRLIPGNGEGIFWNPCKDCFYDFIKYSNWLASSKSNWVNCQKMSKHFKQNAKTCWDGPDKIQTKEWDGQNAKHKKSPDKMPTFTCYQTGFIHMAKPIG